MSVIDNIATRFYSGPVETAFKQTGLHPYLQSIRYRIWLAKHGHRNASLQTYRGAPVPREEMPILDDSLDELRTDDVFYDLGAHKGAFTILVAQAVGCDVVAFEPNPTNAAELREHSSLNGASERVSVHRVALANENTTGGLEIIDDHSSDRLETGEKGETISVDIAKGDNYIQNNGLPQPTVMKIDIEGAEARALRGMEEIIRNEELRAIYVEVHLDHTRDYGDSPEIVRELLRDAGFILEDIHARRRGEYVKAHR